LSGATCASIIPDKSNSRKKVVIVFIDKHLF
jgi:hypothetical protein